MVSDETNASQPTYRLSLQRRLLSISEIGPLTTVAVFFAVFVMADKSMAAPATLVLMAKQ